MKTCTIAHVVRPLLCRRAEQWQCLTRALLRHQPRHIFQQLMLLAFASSRTSYLHSLVSQELAEIPSNLLQTSSTNVSVESCLARDEVERAPWNDEVVRNGWHHGACQHVRFRKEGRRCSWHAIALDCFVWEDCMCGDADNLRLGTRTPKPYRHMAQAAFGYVLWDTTLNSVENSRAVEQPPWSSP